MITVISNVECWDPAPLGIRDVVLSGHQVLRVAASGGIYPNAMHVDGTGKLLLPGLVDALTHPCGGGGEGGFTNRTAEISAETFARAGVTSPVGALGTDCLGRSLDVLYGNVMGLNTKGIGALMYTGAYRVPAPTLTGDVARDLYLVDPVIGVGEVAIADHRGSQPTAAELRRLAAEASLGGGLSGRGGVVMIHVGEGETRLSLLHEALSGSDLPPRVFYPTHVNRSRALLEEAAAWTRLGGYADITVSTTPELIAAGDVPAADALKALLDMDACPDRITLSSDAGGSLPLYVDGVLEGLTQAEPTVLCELLATTLIEDRSDFAAALSAMTANPAAALNLSDRGHIAAGARADVLLLDAATGQLEAVWGGGMRLV